MLYAEEPAIRDALIQSLWPEEISLLPRRNARIFLKCEVDRLVKWPNLPLGSLGQLEQA
jgi:hypothetical protein